MAGKEERGGWGWGAPRASLQSSQPGVYTTPGFTQATAARGVLFTPRVLASLLVARKDCARHVAVAWRPPALGIWLPGPSIANHTSRLVPGPAQIGTRRAGRAQNRAHGPITPNTPIIVWCNAEQLLIEGTYEGPRRLILQLMRWGSWENIRRSLPMCSKYRFWRCQMAIFTAAPSLGSPTSGIDPGTIFGCSGV